MKVKSLSRVRLLATPWTVAHQAPPSMGFSRQEYWRGVPLPSLLETPVSCDFQSMCVSFHEYAHMYTHVCIRVHRSPTSRPRTRTYCQISSNIEVHSKSNVLESPQITSIPCPWKNCLPQNRSLVPKRLGSTACMCVYVSLCLYMCTYMHIFY